jgi:hypothetical protein
MPPPQPFANRAATGKPVRIVDSLIDADKLPGLRPHLARVDGRSLHQGSNSETSWNFLTITYFRTPKQSRAQLGDITNSARWGCLAKNQRR